MNARLPAQRQATTFVTPRGGVRIEAIAEHIQQLRIMAPDWPLAAANDAVAVVLKVRPVEDGWRIEGPNFAAPDQVYREGYELANALVGALSACYLAQDPHLFCLHAAAVQGSDGLIVLLGQNFAGKSTLAAALASRGMALFCDDRLLVRWTEPATAEALGVATKLRLPLPDAAEARLHELIDRHVVWRTPDFAILDGPGVTRARFASHCPLSALVLLNRVDSATETELSVLTRPQLVRTLLQHHFAPHLSSSELLRACTQIASTVPAWTMQYSDLGDGAEVLRLALADGPDA